MNMELSALNGPESENYGSSVVVSNNRSKTGEQEKLELLGGFDGRTQSNGRKGRDGVDRYQLGDEN